MTTGQELGHWQVSQFSNVTKSWNAIMEQKLRMFAMHQTATSLQRTYNLNPRIKWYPVLNESNRMKSLYFIIHLGRNPPPQNGCRLKSISFFKSIGFTSSTFPIQPGFSQNQPDASTLNTGSPRTVNPKTRWEGKRFHVECQMGGTFLCDQLPGSWRLLKSMWGLESAVRRPVSVKFFRQGSWRECSFLSDSDSVPAFDLAH